MAQLPKGHPLNTVYRHLVNYGQQELANDVANFGVMAQHNAEQLRLLQRYVLELEKRDPANSYQAHRQKTLEQRAKIDNTKGNE